MIKERVFFNKFLLSILLILISYFLFTNYFTEKNFYNLNSLKKNELYSIYSLQREKIFEIKEKTINNTDTYDYGVFGNHMVQFWKDPNIDNKSFFNYWFANLSLLEVEHYLFYLEKKKKLPNKKIIIQITTPNNDKGNNIISFRGSLPIKVLSFELASEYLKNENYLLYFDFLISYFFKKFFNKIDTSFFLDSIKDLKNKLFGTPIQRIVTVNEDCLIKKLNCNKKVLIDALEKDGSINLQFHSLSRLVKNEKKKELKSYLKEDDSIIILNALQRISNKYSNENRKIYFLIPPIYSDEKVTTEDKIINKALNFPGNKLEIFDDRYNNDKVNFVNFDHPNDKYFYRVLMKLN